VGLLQQAALALDKTHAAGVVHRDLKPHNLFVSQRDDGSPCLKILDFGIAKLIDSSRASDRTRSAGTPVYMPPEQIRGDGDIGAPADIYALAHIAYTMLVGSPYWEREAVELGLGPFIEAVFKGLPERPSQRAAAKGTILPVAFDGWFARATAPDRAARPATTTQMIAELGQALGVAPSSLGRLDLPAASASPSLAMSPLPGTPPRYTATNVGDGTVVSSPLPFSSQSSSQLASPQQAYPQQAYPQQAQPYATPPPASAPSGVHHYASAPPTVSGPPPLTLSGSTHGAVVSSSHPANQVAHKSSRPIWFVVGALVVLGSVAAGSLLTYRLVASEEKRHAETAVDDDDKPKRPPKPEPPACLYERCQPAKFDPTAAVEPLVVLEDANRLVKSMEGDARLVMITVGETVDGRFPRDAMFSMVFIYRYPKPSGKPGEWAGLQIVVTPQQLMARRSQDVGLDEVTVPKCTGQQALAAAWAAGLPRNERLTLTYQSYPGGYGQRWLVTQAASETLAIRYADGVTCAISNTLVP
jgi:hypothetical protein